VIDAPKLKVDHGMTCAGATHAVATDYIGTRVSGSAILPDNFDGTVFLNGWYATYLNDDHDVAGLGMAIFNLGQAGNKLMWDAGGVITDRDGDDNYRFCYQYTILAWQRERKRPDVVGPAKPRIDVSATHANSSGRLIFVKQNLNGGKKLSASFNSLGKPPAARLLMGFAAGYEDDDHNLLQFGFDLGEAKVNGQRLKWDTDVILQDNSKRSNYAAQMATILAGESVEVWKPKTVLLAAGHPQAPGMIDNDLKLKTVGPARTCIGSATSHAYSFTITGVPFTYGVPMLTGWRVGQTCDDENVRKAGAWIEDFVWDRPPGASTGTLHYTVRTILEDEHPSDVEGLFDGMQVEVLGIDLIEPPGNAPTS
jgi:hypothetical protein